MREPGPAAEKAGSHVAVLMGGRSSERDVSLVSGETAAAALEESGFQVSRIDAADDLALRLLETRPDVVFNMLHGGVGGNGAVQGLLETLAIPYTHSGVLASALATNKAAARTVMSAAGVPVPPGLVVPRAQAAREHSMPPPYVMKPLCEGSSLGLIFVMDEDAPPPAEVDGPGWPYGPEVLVESFVPGKELSCAVLGDRALAVVETLPAREYNDHAEKSAPQGSLTVVPAPLSPEVYHEVQRLSLLAHRALGCRGPTRCDFRYDDRLGTEGIMCLELNNQPGMTPLSLLPELAEYDGMSYGELVRWIVEDASLGR